MINTVRIRGFKRFEDVEFRLPGHVVLVGPNNTGKTTVLQAIASWALALRRWRELNDFNARQGYAKAPIARHAFSAVPLRSFDFLWKDRRYRERIEIELRHNAGWSVAMELIPDSTEQIYVRPKADASAETLRSLDPQTVFVPSMTGLGIDEPLYHLPKIEQLLGLGRPGEVLRNLLAEASRNEVAWERIQSSIEKLFGYEILPPETGGADIIAEYRVAGAVDEEHPRFDIASAGSGFQQVLMLLAFLVHAAQRDFASGRAGCPSTRDSSRRHLSRAEDCSCTATIAASHCDAFRGGYQFGRAARALRIAGRAAKNC